MACDLCGKKGSTRQTRVEGVVYAACVDCQKLGVDATPVSVQKKRSFSKQEDSSVVCSDASRIISSARQKSGVSAKEFAQRLNIKESVLLAWESGKRVPTVSDARRLEKLLGVSLVEQGVVSADASTFLSRDSSQGFTIADLIKDKRKKK
ncbi:MAG: helix-turn-helix domain-containing protein [Candidatus Woesearchaeota archaeon]